MNDPELAAHDTGELSDDHQWRWDGERWQPATSHGMPPAPDEPVTDSHVSANGQWLWDGNRWQPVGH